MMTDVETSGRNMILRSGMFLLWAVASACSRTSGQPSAEVLADARRELEARGRTDQEARKDVGVGGVVDTAQVFAMMRTDSANSAWLKGYVARWGWPTTAQVGHDAVQAAFLIVQHAIHDSAFMRAMLPHIREAHDRGDLTGGAVATLIDRIEVKAGRPQIYGTQLSLKDGQWLFDPIGDSAGVDARRKKMGLPPLTEYRRMVDSMMRAP